MSTSYSEPVLKAAAKYFESLSDDREGFHHAADKIAAVELPAKGSTAEAALSSRPMIIGKTNELIEQTHNHIHEVSVNVAQTLAIYQKGETDNVADIQKIWADLPGGNPTSTNAAYHDNEARIPAFTAPSDGFGEFVSDVAPSLLPDQIVDLAQKITDIPSDVAGVIDYATGILGTVGNMTTDPLSQPWGIEAMGQYMPISRVGAGYRELAKIYYDLANEFDVVGKALLNGWHGPAADQASMYLWTIGGWLRLTVSGRVEALGKDYQDTAVALYKKAATAAGFIVGYTEDLMDLVEGVSQDIMQGFHETEIVIRHLDKFAKAGGEYLLVLQAILLLIQFAREFQTNFRLEHPINAPIVDDPQRGIPK